MRALITGITGQTGSYLTEILLGHGYEVHGLIRRSSSFHTDRIDHLYRDPHDPKTKLFLHYGDLTDASCLEKLVARIVPDEIYNLAAQSHVRVSFDSPIYTGEVVSIGALKLLEATRRLRDSGHDVRIYQASSSEMFGASPPPQGLDTPFWPRSPYAVGKVAAFHYTVNYREAYGLFAVNGILFNHESPRRGETFVTRKITRAVGRIWYGLQDRLYLGNLDAYRDWGHARDYARAIWLMLKQDIPRDLIVATGTAHSVRDFAVAAFDHAGLKAYNFIDHDPKYLRPTEVENLEARASDLEHTRRVIGWEPETSFDELVAEMVEHDLDLAKWEKRHRDEA
jgi:GDPmannose 4,6-dehydratase